MARSTNAEFVLRSQKVADLLLTGSSRYQVLQYATEKWQVAERQVDNYIKAARALIAEEAEGMREQMLSDHLVRRRRLYNLAVAGGDLRTALSISDSEAKLMGLFVDRVETTLTGQIDTTSMTSEQRKAYLQKLDRKQTGAG